MRMPSVEVSTGITHSEVLGAPSLNAMLLAVALEDAGVVFGAQLYLGEALAQGSLVG
jgi:hypothetical protein